MKENQSEKIEKIRGLLAEAMQQVAELDKVDGEHADIKDWLPNRLEFWSRIFLDGGVIPEKRAHEIWEKEMKKDPRGYGGNFVGKRPSLQYTLNGDIILTASANEKCLTWTGKTLEAYAERFMK